MELKHLNTLALDCQAIQFREVSNVAELPQALQAFSQAKLRPIVIGDGSNIVFRSATVAACIKLANKGIKLVDESAGTAILDVAAGENWNALVNSSLSAGYYGLENLALIPGTVGAAPIQNIGAYGVELSEFVEQVTFRDLATAERHTYSAAQCEFAYRESIFKNKLRDATVIESVRLKLHKRASINLRYAALAEALERQKDPTPQDVRDAVVKMRSAKLPDPAFLANAGSFFKNPMVSIKQLDELRQKFDGIVFYPSEDPRRFKLAAAWLIDHAGWRGRYENGFGMHAQQALVLVNQGTGSGEELLKFAERVQQSVQRMFAVELQLEPRIY